VDGLKAIIYEQRAELEQLEKERDAAREEVVDKDRIEANLTRKMDRLLR